MSLKRAVQIRLQDPRIILNEFFGYLSMLSGLVTACLLMLGHDDIYKICNQILLASCALQNLPLLMVYLPQWRLLISGGILGIIVTNYFATLPIGNAFREGLFVALIKLDYSYEALIKYHPDKYQSEQSLLSNKKSLTNFIVKLRDYFWTICKETLLRSWEFIIEIKQGNFKVLIYDPIRSQFFSSLMRIISALPLFVIAGIEILEYFGYFHKSPEYSANIALWTSLSVRALACSSFVDGLSKIAFGFMRESFMMRLGGCIFAFAQFYLIFAGENSLKLVIPLSLAGLAAYPIVESERLRRLALEA